MSRFANNALLGGGVRVRVWIREQRKIKRKSKALLSPSIMHKCILVMDDEVSAAITALRGHSAA